MSSDDQLINFEKNQSSFIEDKSHSFSEFYDSNWNQHQIERDFEEMFIDAASGGSSENPRYKHYHSRHPIHSTPERRRQDVNHDTMIDVPGIPDNNVNNNFNNTSSIGSGGCLLKIISFIIAIVIVLILIAFVLKKFGWHQH